MLENSVLPQAGLSHMVFRLSPSSPQRGRWREAPDEGGEAIDSATSRPLIASHALDLQAIALPSSGRYPGETEAGTANPPLNRVGERAC